MTKFNSVGYTNSQYRSLTNSELGLNLHPLILNVIDFAYSELLINCNMMREGGRISKPTQYNKVNFQESVRRSHPFLKHVNIPKTLNRIKDKGKL